MTMPFPARLPASAAVLLLALAGPAPAQDAPLRFQVRLSGALADRPVSGRLFVLMTNAPGRRNTIEPGFGGMKGVGTVYIAAQEVSYWQPGRDVVLNPDTLAYPAPLSSARRDNWQVMALLDVDHSFAYSGQGPGDLSSEVLRWDGLDPASAGTRELVLTRATPRENLEPPAGMSIVNFQSPALSRFWGRPVFLRAGVALPPAAAGNRGRRFPTVYHIHGFGAPARTALGLAGWPGLPGGAGFREAMRADGSPEMAHVFLEAAAPMGHTAFADSVNNGPVGTALVRELIPYLERRFPLAAEPRGRFLTGHSSGGWSALWLQVAYPTSFNGVWATAPDAVDFRSFSGANIAADAPENLYRTPQQTERNLVRFGGRNVMSMREFAQFEQVAGAYGGQMASFEAVFSPRGPDGRPMPLFNRQTGAVDPRVARAWRKYDIHRVLAAGWPRLAPLLRGKLHIVAAAQDNFHLEESVALLRAFLRGAGSDAVVEVTPNRDHMNLYYGGLMDRLLREMEARYRATAPRKPVSRPGSGARRSPGSGARATRTTR